MSRPFFPLFFKDQGKLQYLSMEQRGELLTALFDYAANGSIPKLDGLTGFAFEVFRERIDTSLVAYEEVCQKNRENGRKGGRPRKNQTASEKTERFSGETQRNPEKPNGFQKKPKETQKTEKEVEEGRENKEVYEDVKYRSRSNEEIATADINKLFLSIIGREPNRAWQSSVGKLDLPMEMIEKALRKALEKGIDPPEAYTTTVLREWAANPDDYQRQLGVNDPDAPLEEWEREWMEQLDESCI